MADGDDGEGPHRFDGVLGPEDLALARARGIPLAYDPVQIGWVRVDARDDADMAPSLSWFAGADHVPLHKRIAGTPVYPVAAGLSFRLWVEGDLPHYREMLGEAGLWTFMPEPRPDRLDDQDLTALIALSAEAPHHRVRAIISGGRPVGQVRLELSSDGRSAELSYWLGAAFRRRGLGTRAVAAFLDRMLPRLPQVSAVVARVHPDNDASRRLLRACGFRSVARAEAGLAPRGRDTGDWPVFRRDLP